ncbi:TetR family transcriptional regulator [Epidermidibacterium keratini]|uniref:TetR family transcriptional regulator n=1 Tax=Epidermidibacterium keratini TaxID=1891644 RepID=A0A7L4YMY5_9ACTN|nr:TetR family transcriptional regulator [Epidermidibacterium keratini]QHB99896.1 TetR family transcriptional regulator [Epidermidibacterium keratini]
MTAPITAPERTILAYPRDDATFLLVLQNAISAFGARGYHGTSVRDIATAAGVSPGTIYNHFGSKAGLLEVIMNRGMDVLINASEQALYDAPAEPLARLDALVEAHVRVHAASSTESYIGNSELRSLDVARYATVVAKRDAQQRMFDRVIADGVQRGVFKTSDPKSAARYVVTACTAVASWFRTDGAMSIEELVGHYQQISRRAVGFQERR